MTKIAFFFSVLVLLAGCSTSVHIMTKPEGVKARINGEPVGTTPLTKNLSDSDFASYDITLQKDGYQTIHTTLEKELKAGAIVGGFFLDLIPWFWAYGPKPNYYFELDPLPKSEQPALMSSEDNTSVKSEEPIDLKKLNVTSAVGIWKSKTKLKTVVLDFDSSYSGSDGKSVAELFSVELVNRGIFTVLDRSQIARIMDEQKLQLTGITSEEKGIKIGQLLGADKVITGSVLKIGGNYFITVKGISVSSGSVEISDRVSSTSLNGLINGIPALVDNFTYQAIGEK